MKKYALLVFTYYSYRAILLHILFFTSILPNTRIIALFVWLFSQFFLHIWPGYRKKYTLRRIDYLEDFLLHWIWILIIPISINQESIFILLGSVTIYSLVHKPSNIYTYYYSRKETIDKILS